MSDVQRFLVAVNDISCESKPYRSSHTHDVYVVLADAYDALLAKEITAYREGMKAGMRLYAWWKDGVQYVGSCGTTLEKALAEIEKEIP